MILEGAMIACASILLTAFHPGLAFGYAWADADWQLFGKPPLHDNARERVPSRWNGICKKRGDVEGESNEEAKEDRCMA